MSRHEWNVEHLDFPPSDCHGMWFVYAGWDKFLHLHSDGETRLGTQNTVTGEFTGYFPSREAAEAAVERWRQEND